MAYRIYTNGKLRVTNGQRAKKSVIVYGPPGSGKTRNAELIRDFFGYDKVCDGASMVDFNFPKKGHVVLTNDVPDENLLLQNRLTAYSVEQLKRLMPKWI